MTDLKRTYTAKRLLEHGGLTRGEFIAITGWPEVEVDSTLRTLVKTEVAQRHNDRGHRGYRYALAKGARA